MEKIINFTNTTNEDFVGMYHGEEFPVKAGETKTLTENVAKHIAGQLATYVLIRDKTVKNYLTDAKREPLIKEMLGELVIPEEKEVPQEEKSEEKEEEKEFEDLPKKVKKPRKKAKK